MTGCEGQDWSSYQPSTPPTTGLGFVIVKATEGAFYVNPRHAAQVAHARAAGLVVGHYHFARPGPLAAQTAYFLQHADAQPGDVLALDWEDPGVTGGQKDAWLKAVRAAAPGHRVILYCNLDFWLHRDTTSSCGDGLWIADPDSPKGQPAIKAPWLIHQYSDARGTDRDYCRLTAAQLHTWALGNTPTPEDDVALTAAQAAALAAIPDLVKKVNSLHDDVMSIKSLDGDGTHAIGYYAAHTRHDALAAVTAVQDLKKQLDVLQAALTDPAAYIAQVAAGLANLQITVTPKEN